MTKTKETLADRIKAARLERGLSQTALAALARVSQTTIASLESGRASGSRHVVVIAKALGKDPDWLMTGEGNADSWDVQFSQEKHDHYVPGRRADIDGFRLSVDRYTFARNIENGSLEWELKLAGATEIPINALHQLRARIEDCRAVEVLDDSMEPFLYRQDLCVVDSLKTTVRDAHVYAVSFEGEQLFRQIFKEAGGTLRLHALNAKFQDKLIPAEHASSMVIAGEVVFRSGYGFAL